MCRQCPTLGGKYGEPGRGQYCTCGCSQVKNGRCERCGHSLDFYKRDDTYRPKYEHRWGAQAHIDMIAPEAFSTFIKELLQ